MKFSKDYIIGFISGEVENGQTQFRSSKFLKEKYYGDKVIIRGLLEISNYCKNECLYCGINSRNNKITRYRMTSKEIYNSIDIAYKNGYRSFVIQGGDDPFFRDKVLLEIVNSLKTNFDDIAITLSLGERSYDSYKKLFDEGVDRYLLRHESVNKELYSLLHPNQSLENRIKCLYNLKEIGYQVGTGFMVGLPSQSYEDIYKDLEFISDLEPEMVGIGPFIPHKDTKLKDYKRGNTDELLRILVLIRNILPKALIPATTALGTASNEKHLMALKYSANVVMPNITPNSYRKKYQLYNDKKSKTVEELITKGIKISKEKGDHYDFRKKLYR